MGLCEIVAQVVACSRGAGCVLTRRCLRSHAGGTRQAGTTVSNMAEDLYCICRRTYDQTQFMIQCDACDDWFHGSCVGVEEWQANDIEIYHCPNCSPDFGPFTLKKRQNYHRHDHSDQKAQTKAVQAGTLVFIKQLKSKQFSSAENILQKCHGRELGLDFLMKKGFRKPILVETKDGLGMVVPDRSFTVADVQRYVGPSIELDIIDVTKQLVLEICAGFVILMILAVFVLWYKKRRLEYKYHKLIQNANDRSGEMPAAPQCIDDEDEDEDEEVHFKGSGRPKGFFKNLKNKFGGERVNLSEQYNFNNFSDDETIGSVEPSSNTPLH